MVNFKTSEATKAYDDAHKNSDTDNEASSIHHTLGHSPVQAAPGNHNHDADYSPVGHTHPNNDTGWINCTLVNGWVWYGSPWETPQYRKINGITYIKGLVKNGTAGSTIFTLPANMAPSQDMHLASVAASAIAVLNVFADGRVVHNSGSTTWITVSGIAFPAAAGL